MYACPRRAVVAANPGACSCGSGASIWLPIQASRAPAQHDEGVDLGRFLGAHIPDRPVAAHPGLAQGRDARIILDEADGRREAVEEPAPAAIVEIDEPGAFGIDRQVRQPHVGMDQVEAVRRLAECLKPVTDGALDPFQNPGNIRRHFRRVTPVSPCGVGPEDDSGLPCQPLESVGLRVRRPPRQGRACARPGAAGPVVPAVAGESA